MKLECSWLTEKGVKGPWKIILKGDFEAQTCKIMRVENEIAELKQKASVWTVLLINRHQFHPNDSELQLDSWQGKALEQGNL